MCARNSAYHHDGFMQLARKLKKGDLVQIIAPARSLSIISETIQSLATKRLKDLGLEVSFGSFVNEKDIFDSSTVASRLNDVHNAFGNKNIKAILSVIGGFNSNQLLKYIDYDLIKSNPKILCGYSDITCLTNAIYSKTGLITYSGPHYSTLGETNGIEYILDYFQKCLFTDEEYEVLPSQEYYDQNHKEKNMGIWLMNEGEADGTIIGGNLCSLNLLQGTEYMPSLNNSILFLEDDHESHSATFDRDLQSLICLPQFVGVVGIAIGRFQESSEMTFEKLKYIIDNKSALKKIPIVANLDFGHTRPMITFPIGGKCIIQARPNKINITIYEH